MNSVAKKFLRRPSSGGHARTNPRRGEAGADHRRGYFPVRIPVTDAEAEAGYMNRYIACQGENRAGVTGYSFAGPPARRRPLSQGAARGKDLFNIDAHSGKVCGSGVEWSMRVWDAIGKIAGQPVYKLLGGAADRVKAYLTCVWKGNADQQQVPFEEQVGMAVKIRKAGFKGMKIRGMASEPDGRCGSLPPHQTGHRCRTSTSCSIAPRRLRSRHPDSRFGISKLA